MDRFKCKLCSKAFSNGRALGGHMRSHFASLPIPPKPILQQQQLSDSTESASSLSSSSSSEEEDKEGEDKSLVYVLRENPKKSLRVVDPESVVQDRESETESPRNPTRRRSKRRTLEVGFARKRSSAESVAKLEQVSSVSDTSPEEDVALCLMMLSRDAWSSVGSNQSRSTGHLTRKKFHRETCRTSQRTSHAKVNNCFQDDEDGSSPDLIADQKVHECSICYRVFGSGQALGGHKRSHLISASSAAAVTSSGKFGKSSVEKKSVKFGESLIDLNSPAPIEDDDLSQPEVSAVSDAEFIYPVKN
ncbi:hypothetical protein U1Q18_019382 [Sarracenia purpurea var. burkii]